MSDNHKTSGFTLIEITMVLILIGILAAVALPKYFDNVAASRRTICLHNQALVVQGFANRVAVSQIDAVERVTPDTMQSVLDSIVVELQNSVENHQLCPEGGTYTSTASADAQGHLSATVSCSYENHTNGDQDGGTVPYESIKDLYEKMLTLPLSEQYATLQDYLDSLSAGKSIDSTAYSTGTFVGLDGKEYKTMAAMIAQSLSDKFGIDLGDKVWKVYKNKNGGYSLTVADVSASSLPNRNDSVTNSIYASATRYDSATGKETTGYVELQKKQSANNSVYYTPTGSLYDKVPANGQLISDENPFK